MNKIAVVSGASRGIGQGVCQELSRRGWDIVATARGPVDEAAVRTGQDGQVLLHQADVTDEAQVGALAAAVTERFGRLDLLVNVAGVMPPPTVVETTTAEDWDTAMATNVTGPFLMSRAFLPLLTQTSGSAIVNITGMLGTFASGMEGGGQPAYRVSKAALNALSLTLSEELKDKDVRVVALDPGWVRTDMGGPDAPRSVEEVATELADYAEKPELSGVLIRGGQAQPW